MRFPSIKGASLFLFFSLPRDIITMPSQSKIVGQRIDEEIEEFHLKLFFPAAKKSLHGIYDGRRRVPLGESRLSEIRVHDVLHTP